MHPEFRLLTSPVLIGRDSQVVAIDRALEHALGGLGQVLLISGEAGIGKSRLVAEARGRAVRMGFHILEGHCFESDHVLPYAPLLDVLRSHLSGRATEELRQQLEDLGPELVRLLPELSTSTLGLQPAPPLEPEQEKRRLFHALSQCFIGLSTRQPALIIIEDLHWSDHISLELLLYLARRITSCPVLLVLTYRSDEVDPWLSHMLAELDRQRLAVELTLGRLNADEVEALLAILVRLDRPLRPAFVEAIDALTEGNPFFIEEVTRTLSASGEAGSTWAHVPVDDVRIPRSVQDAVRQRVERLSNDARRALTLAAVAGRRFDFTLLRELLGCDEEHLLRLIKELIAAQLVVEISAEQYAFRHSLTRQAVYVELLARERRAMHRSIAEVLEHLYTAPTDARVEDLAYHFYEAEAWDRAMEYGLRAGERAQALYAPRAAITQLDRAADAADRLGQSPPVRLLRNRGRAHAILGDFEQARSDYELALSIASAAADRSSEWLARIDLGFLWLGRDDEQALRFFRQALDLARDMDDPLALAHSLNRVGNWYISDDRPFQALTYHEEALSIVERLNDRPGIAATLDLLGMAAHVAGDLPRSEGYYTRAVALFRELDDRQGLASSLPTLQLLHVDSYYSDTMVRPVTQSSGALEGEEAASLARAIGWRSGESYALYMLSDGYAARGEYGRAIDRAHASLAIAEEIEHRAWVMAAHCGLGMIYVDLLAFPFARRHLEQGLVLAREMGSRHWIFALEAHLPLACLPDRDLAHAAVMALDADLADDIDLRVMGQRHAMCARAEFALATGDSDHALWLAEQLIASATNLTSGHVIPRLWKLWGDALAATGRIDEAETVLAAAEVAAREQGSRRWLWRIEVSLGRLYQAQARDADAERVFSAARNIVDELADTVPDQQLRETFLHGAASMFPSQARSVRTAARTSFGGLTPREREVATLIAQGKTNRAIADELFLSERTVEGHVTNILNKLAFNTRAQIAAWVVEHRALHH